MNINLNAMKSREDWLRLFAMLGEEACKILSATAPDVLSWHNLESKFFENAFPPVPASSRIDYKRWMQQIKEFAAEEGLEEPGCLASRHADRFAQALISRGVSPGRRFRFYRRLWRTVSLDAKVWNTPQSVVRLRTEHYRRLTVGELQRLLAVAQASDPDAADMIRLGYWTGLRLSDIAELERAETRLDIMALEIVPNKVRKKKPYPIRIPLAGDAISIVSRRMSEISDVRYLFPPDCRIRPSRRIKRIFSAAGVIKRQNGRASFHSLRATFISLMDEAGVQPYITDAITGHSNGGMHARYTQPSLETLRAAILRAIPPLQRNDGSDMVSGPRYTGRDEKSELGLARGRGDRRCEIQTVEES